MGPNKLYAKAIYGDEPKTMEEMAWAVIKVIDEHRDRRVSGTSRRPVYTESPKVECVGFSWQVTHSDHVSNSHSNPEGYPSNFGGKPGVPTGYPGWTGRVWVRYKHEQGYTFGSDPFSRTLTHTGTGGAGGYRGPWEEISTARWRRFGNDVHGDDVFAPVKCYSWDFRIYDYDWPEVTASVVKQYEKDCVWAVLNNSPVPNQINHYFLWEDPAQKALDQAFLATSAAMVLVDQ